MFVVANINQSHRGLLLSLMRTRREDSYFAVDVSGSIIILLCIYVVANTNDVLGIS
jgi:hypothetical protein